MHTSRAEAEYRRLLDALDRLEGAGWVAVPPGLTRLFRLLGEPGALCLSTEVDEWGSEEYVLEGLRPSVDRLASESESAPPRVRAAVLDLVAAYYRLLALCRHFRSAGSVSGAGMNLMFGTRRFPVSRERFPEVVKSLIEEGYRCREEVDHAFCYREDDGSISSVFVAVVGGG